MKILFFGLEGCAFTEKAIAALTNTDAELTLCLMTSRLTKLPDDVRSWRGDLILSFKNYIKLPITLLDSARLACINFHPALPEYPGSGGLAWSIYDEKEYYGVTVHLMNEDIDSGKILEVHKMPLEQVDDLISLTSKLNERHLQIFMDFLETHLIHFSESNLRKYLNQTDNKLVWSSKIYRLAELKKMKIIDTTISKKEFLKRRRAFHLHEYPLQIKHHDHLFDLRGRDQ